VGILLHEKYEQCIESIDYIKDRILKISLKIHHMQTHLISTYALDISKPIEESETFYQDLRNTIDRLSNTDKYNRGFECQNRQESNTRHKTKIQ